MARFLIALTLLLTPLLAGCESAPALPREPAAGVKKDSYRIAVIPKGLTHVFWNSVHYGARQAAEELGNVEIIWQGAAREDQTQDQINVVRNMVTDRVDGICLAPQDAQALIQAVEDANAANTPVVIFDSALDDEDIIVSYVATNNYKCGAAAARKMAELLNGQGDVLLVRYKQGSESTEQREQGFLDTLEKEYPDVKILDQQWPTAPTTAAAKDLSLAMLQTHGENVDGVFTVCEPLTTGMLDALEDMDMAGKVKFVGFDPTPRFVAAMEENTIHGVVLQDPVKMGYESVKTIVAHLNGEKVGPQVDTGEHIATPENMNTPEMQKLLNPPTQAP